ncbi:MAG TPA: alpha-amylase family glycosyl hydrolase [Rectinemataceae bacterium]|nr:alpha-amylase family glycosyl hydrolase [Rectinemataceae bacterium]
MAAPKDRRTPWWEDAVFYQIYPRSFMDSNADGIGDLAGIAGRLDYLEWLGVDALWISPFFPSPMKDFGYDVADYRGIDPIFGTMGDFLLLMTEAKKRGIRVILDLVANHSSEEHPWFVDARSSRESPRHDWYIWVPETGKAPNNWKSLFELRSAWYPNPATGERYLATFTHCQPEFNWRNPEVRGAFYDIMKYWYGLGVDGFRLDVATAYAKDPALRSNPFSLKANPDFFQKHVHDRNHPDFHGFFKEMRRVADESPKASPDASEPGERILIGETHGQDPALAASCHGDGDDELHMAFNFDFLRQPWRAKAFRGSAERWYSLMPQGAWPNFTLSNHDQPRHIWRYRADDPEITLARAKVAAAMLLTLRGSPFLYYGEEIGMGCFRLPRKALRDPLGIRTWPLAFLGRDPERTPMQWDGSPGGGFGSSSPWLPLNPDWRECNVAAQRELPESLLLWYRSLLALRRAEAALRRGTMRFLEKGADILAYERSDEASGRRVVVLLNFGSRGSDIAVGEELRVLLGSGRPSGSVIAAGEVALGPCEVLVASLQPT